MKLFKKIKFVLIIIMGIFLISSNIAYSQGSPLQTDNIKTQTDAFQLSSGYTATGDSGSVSNIIAKIIFIALSILAIVFIILIIIAGFQWMTAGGSEEQITKAKKNISNAVIGLVIILSAYALTWFIFNYLPMSAGTGDGGGGVDTPG